MTPVAGSITNSAASPPLIEKVIVPPSTSVAVAVSTVVRFSCTETAAADEITGATSLTLVTVTMMV